MSHADIRQRLRTVFTQDAPPPPPVQPTPEPATATAPAPAAEAEPRVLTEAEFLAGVARINQDLALERAQDLRAEWRAIWWRRQQALAAATRAAQSELEVWRTRYEQKTVGATVCRERCEWQESVWRSALHQNQAEFKSQSQSQSESESPPCPLSLPPPNPQ